MAGKLPAGAEDCQPGAKDRAVQLRTKRTFLLGSLWIPDWSKGTAVR